MGSSLKSPPSSPSDNTEREKKECRPKQNNCSSAGVGPSCSNATNLSNPGATAKRNCLERVKKECDEALKDCLEKCKNQQATSEKEISGVAQVKGTPNGDYFIRCGKGNYLKDSGIAPNRQNFQAGGSDSYRGITDEAKNTEAKNLIPILRDLCSCSADCYKDAYNNCDTAHCYCGSYKCEYQTGEGAGFGGGNSTKDPYTQREEENKLKDVQFNTTSQVDVPIELVYSRADLPGNVVWMGELVSKKTVTTTRTVDRAKRTITTTKRYQVSTTVDMLLGLCAGEIDTIDTIKLDGTVIYQRGTRNQNSINFDLYNGSENQKVNSEHAYAVGFGKAPAYRGTAMLKLNDFSLTSLTKFPQLTVTVVRNASTSDAFYETNVLSGSDTSLVFSFIPEAERMFIETNDGLVCVDTDNMEPVWTAPINNAIEVTPSGRPITFDGTNVGVYEQPFNNIIGSYVARTPGIVQTFILRLVDSVGNAGIYLLSESSDGRAYLEQIEEVTPTFPSDSMGVIPLPTMDTAPHDLAIVADMTFTDYASIQSSMRSAFLFRVGRLTYDTIVGVELRMFSEDNDLLVEDGATYGFSIPENTFNGSFSLVLKGGFFDKNSDSFILFASDNSGNYIIKWHPRDGVVWKVTTDYVPNQWKYSCVSDDDLEGEYLYVTTSGALRSLSLNEGIISTLATDWPSVAGKQFYDARKRHIVYEAASGRLVRGVVQETRSTLETVEDAVRDIAKRAGLPRSAFDTDGLDALEIKGFRSATLTYAADILRVLSEVYLVQFSSERNTKVTTKTQLSVIEVDENYLQNRLSRQRSVSPPENKAITVNYFSTDMDGEGGQQTFALDLGEEARLVPVSANAFTWPVSASDEYMRRLAEVYAYASQESSINAVIKLPPRYLTFTVGDVARLNFDGRVKKMVIGADSSVELSIAQDSVDKYADLVSIGGLPTPSLRVDTTRRPDTLAAPLAVSLKPILPTSSETVGIYAGATDLLNEFNPVTQVSQNAFEFNPAPSSAVANLSNPSMWGRLVTPPILVGSAIFVTHEDAFLDIDFAQEAYVDRIMAKPSRFGEYPDYRTVNVEDYNMLIVGKELIQYGFATKLSAKRIRFSNLLRGRHDTDAYLAHTPGEFCLYYEKNSVSATELIADDAPFSLNLITGGNGEFRRYDAMPDETALRPCDPGHVLRMDVKQEGSGLAGNEEIPSSPHVLFFIRLREGGVNGFTNNLTTLAVSGVQFRREIYILRGSYDEALFNASRYNESDKTYVMLSRHYQENNPLILEYESPDQRALSGFTLATPYPYPEKEELVYFFSGFRQYIYLGGGPVPAWDYRIQDLTFVLINVTSYGESRAVYYFNKDINYYNQPVAGLRVN